MKKLFSTFSFFLITILASVGISLFFQADVLTTVFVVSIAIANCVIFEAGLFRRTPDSSRSTLGMLIVSAWILVAVAAGAVTIFPIAVGISEQSELFIPMRVTGFSVMASIFLGMIFWGMTEQEREKDELRKLKAEVKKRGKIK